MEPYKARIVFMGTPDFSIPSLRMLIDEGYNVVCVVTQEDKKKGRGKKLTPGPVKQEAEKRNIPVLEPSSLRTKLFREEILRFSPDLYITIAYGKIIPADILSLPSLGCINVHASLLPKYRGPAPVWWAVINGDTVTGITTMYTDEGIDTGDMLIKKEIPIGYDTTAGELSDSLSILGAKALLQTLDKLFAGTLIRTKQAEKEASYAPLIKKELGHINWYMQAAGIRNLIRGLDPWPGAYSYYQETRMRIVKADIAKKNEGLIPGTIADVTKEGIFVAAKDFHVRIEKIQMPDKRIMTVAEYINGNEIKRGVKLG